jgi:ABC-2 type transport system ATP-binding protein
MRYPALDQVRKEERVSGEAAIETEGLVKRFGDTLAVDDVSLAVEQGEVRGLLGRNGAGKTTLLRLLFGLLPPDAGTVRVFGRLAGPEDVEARAAVAGYVEEPRFYPYLSARRNLELLGRLDGAWSSERADEALERLGLGRSRDRPVGNFSTGMRQRLGLAAALLREPRLLLLDEPTIGLDPPGARDVRELVQELAQRGVTVLLSSHDMSEVAEVCDGVVIVRSGRVVWDGTLDRLRDEATVPEHHLWTSDDARALAVGRSQPGLEIERYDHRLSVRAGDEPRDALVLALAAAGVAVRRLEPAISPLELLFTRLTGEEAA